MILINKKMRNDKMISIISNYLNLIEKHIPYAGETILRTQLLQGKAALLFFYIRSSTKTFVKTLAPI